MAPGKKAVIVVEEKAAAAPSRQTPAPVPGSVAKRLPVFSSHYGEACTTLASMTAKARGVKLHPGPLKLRKSLPSRDCTSWVRDDHQYDPYWSGDKTEVKPREKKAVPLPLWLPPSAKEREAAAAQPKEVPPWDAEHHVMYSRMNSELQQGFRQYFDKPKRKEGEGIPKMRERYAMNDRQAGWLDDPAPLGESRRTLFDNIGPYNLGGCKQHQMPSYWRKIKDWSCYDSTPDLPVVQKPPEDADQKKGLLMALADMPAAQARAFWKGWLEAKAAAKAQAKGEQVPEPTPEEWDERWNVIWSRANQDINPRQREYFSVPFGANGQATEKPRSKTVILKHPLARSYVVV